MKRVFDHSSALLMPLIGAISGLSLIAADTAAAQSLGGFPIREPGARQNGSQGGSVASPIGQMPEVVVSQAADSRVQSIAVAMRLVKPGGTILVQGGTYNENVVVTKPVTIRGIPDAYGRSAIVRPVSSDPCLSIAPTSPVAAVNISDMVFEFDQTRASQPCIDIHGGTVKVEDSFIVPRDSTIMIRAAYDATVMGRGNPGNTLRPRDLDLMARPPRDRSEKSQMHDIVEQYVPRHGTAFGADNGGWDTRSGGTPIDQLIHAQRASAGGAFTGPQAGVRVTAGDTRLDGNVIVGAHKAVAYESYDNARVQGVVSNNVLIGNGIGVSAIGYRADLDVTRNTIRYNEFEGIKADVYDGLSLVANEISGNATGIFLSENVRTGVVNSNFVAINQGDALIVSTGFHGAVAGNTFVGNGGCTIDFYSAEQRYLNDAVVPVTAYQNFQPVVLFEASNQMAYNASDRELTKKQIRRMKKENISQSMPVCDQTPTN